ncbi:MAG: LamG-like jellyroll fold domain-containing protein, partial [bacterium]
MRADEKYFTLGGGDAIQSWQDLSPNGYSISGINPNEPILIRNAISGSDVARFNGSSQYLEHTTSVSLYNYLHETKGTVGILYNVTLADPNTRYVFLANQDFGSGRGIAIHYDDRASASRNDVVLADILNGTAGQSESLQSPNDYFTTQQWNFLVVNFRYNESTDSLNYFINNTNKQKLNRIFSPVIGNANNDLTIGRIPTGGRYFQGDIREIFIVKDRNLT